LIASKYKNDLEISFTPFTEFLKPDEKFYISALLLLFKNLSAPNLEAGTNVTMRESAHNTHITSTVTSTGTTHFVFHTIRKKNCTTTEISAANVL
jgi:hypothetical protein